MGISRMISQKTGEFVRKASAFRHQIGSNQYPAEAGRYHIYISYACPWAHRALMMWKLKGLQNVISLSSVDPILGDSGWSFGQTSRETLDPLYNASYLKELYHMSDPNYDGKATTPMLWDKKTNTVVNNESSEIMRMLATKFDAYTEVDNDFYPEKFRDDIDQLDSFVYEHVSNGVYRCGFAKSKEAYEEAKSKLFEGLDELDHHLTYREYLIGDQLTEADLKLFPTLVRFDDAYYPVFKCNDKKLSEYKHLSHYVQRLMDMPTIRETVNFDHIHQHYHQSPRMQHILTFLENDGVSNIEKGSSDNVCKK